MSYVPTHIPLVKIMNFTEILFSLDIYDGPYVALAYAIADLLEGMR